MKKPIGSTILAFIFIYPVLSWLTVFFISYKPEAILLSWFGGAFIHSAILWNKYFKYRKTEKEICDQIPPNCSPQIFIGDTECIYYFDNRAITFFFFDKKLKITSYSIKLESIIDCNIMANNLYLEIGHYNIPSLSSLYIRLILNDQSQPQISLPIVTYHSYNTSDKKAIEFADRLYGVIVSHINLTKPSRYDVKDESAKTNKIEERLATLNRLKASSLISETEYEDKKRAIINDI